MANAKMRRHDTTRPWGERVLLKIYWALSGYGLRATRALAWLGAAMAVTIAVMMLWGLPSDDPKADHHRPPGLPSAPTPK